MQVLKPTVVANLPHAGDGGAAEGRRGDETPGDGIVVSEKRMSFNFWILEISNSASPGMSPRSSLNSFALFVALL